jgi:hypothetical protein
MYKEKYLKYKTKYTTLKKQLGGDDDFDIIADADNNTLSITKKTNNFKLIINYNTEEISLIDTNGNQTVFFKNKIPSSDKHNQRMNEWLYGSGSPDKPIYKQLIEKAKTELEKDKSTIEEPFKQTIISQFDFYIDQLEFYINAGKQLGLKMNY